MPDVAVDIAPKKRKRDLRGLRSKGKGDASSRNAGPSSNRPQLHPNDCTSAGLASTVSNLLSRHGVLQEQFHQMFRVCDYCRRIVCNETSLSEGHVCVIEVED